MNNINFLATPAAKHPDREALIFGAERYTYQQLLDMAGRLANGLYNLGIRRADRVALVDVSSVPGILLYYGCAILGAAYVPLNYRAKAQELRFLLTDSGVKLAFIGANYVSLISEIQDQLPPNLQFVALPGATLPDKPNWLEYNSLINGDIWQHREEVEPEELSALIYTSGTTANPKGVRLTFGDLDAYVRGAAPAVPPTEKTLLMVTTPLYHISGLCPILNNFYYGVRMVWLPQFDAGTWLKTVEQYGVTSTFVVPTMLRHILDHPNFASTNLSSLMAIAYGAAPMPLPLIERAIKAFPPTTGFLQAYGQTETTATVAALGPEDHRIGQTPEELEKTRRRLSSVGKALADVEIRIADDNGETVPPGTVGEIVVRGERVMQGYDRQEEATKMTIKNGWLHTRDMGYMDEDGYIYLAGRKSDMIIRGGENISSDEVENVLYTHPAVAEVAVVGVPDEEWGEKVAAIVVLNKGYEPDADALREHARSRLASFKKPEIIEFVDELPRNTTGKILKKSLRERFAPVKK